jgi:hypothetical protein
MRLKIPSSAKVVQFVITMPRKREISGMAESYRLWTAKALSPKAAVLRQSNDEDA